MKAEKDSELLSEWVNKRSEQSFRVLMQRHMGLVAGVVYRQLDAPSDRDDVIQEVFTQLAFGAKKIHNPAALPGWLYRCAVHACKARKRSFMRHRRKLVDYGAESSQGSIGGISQGDSILGHLDDALLVLSQEEREILLLRYVYGYNMKEVARLFGVTPVALQKRSERALNKTKQYIEENKRKELENSIRASFPLLLAPASTWPNLESIFSKLAHPASVPLGMISHIMNTKALTLTAVCVGALIPIGWQQVEDRRAVVSSVDSSGIDAQHRDYTLDSKGVSSNEMIIVITDMLNRFPPRRGRIQKELQICKLISTLTLDECRELKAVIMRHPNLSQLSVMAEFLFQRWAELEPKEAYVQAKEFSNWCDDFGSHPKLSANELPYSVVREWAYQNPEEVMESGLARAGRGPFIDTRLRRLAMENMAAKYGYMEAMKWAKEDSRDVDALTDFGVIMQKWGKENLKQALSKLSERELHTHWPDLFWGAYQGKDIDRAYQLLFEYGDTDVYFDAGARWRYEIGAHIIKRPETVARELENYFLKEPTLGDQKRVLDMIQKMGVNAAKSMAPHISDLELRKTILLLHKDEPLNR